jgi:hypothetical protein
VSYKGLCVASRDLGITRSPTGSYTTHCETTAIKACRVAGAIRRTFQLHAHQLLWPAFQSYVAPVIMYASPMWNPMLHKDVKALERVQRRYTKCMYGLRELPYAERLKALGALSLEKRRLFADMVLVHKVLNGQLGCSAAELGLTRVTSHTRSNGIKLVQRRATNRVTSALFCIRAPREWNQLPLHITSSKSLLCLRDFVPVFIIRMTLTFNFIELLTIIVLLVGVKTVK